MSPRTDRQQVHELETIAEDLLLTGGSSVKAYCSCRWESRPATTEGVARGLWRRHLVMAGRGQTRAR